MSLEYSPAHHSGRVAFTVNEFCDAHRISRSKLLQLWKAGTGPRFMRIGGCGGGKILITAEAAADWRRACEAATEAV